MIGETINKKNRTKKNHKQRKEKTQKTEKKSKRNLEIEIKYRSEKWRESDI